MPNPDDKDAFLFLLTCSSRTLGNFLLKRLDLHAQIKKELMLRVEEICDRMAYNLSDIRNANLLRDHGEEIIERLTAPQLRGTLTPIPPQKAPKLLASKIRKAE